MRKLLSVFGSVVAIFITVKIIPFRMRAYERWNGRSWQPVADGMFAKGERVRYEG